MVDKFRPHWLSGVLRRGAGMGGPLSPPTWNVGFDPVVWATQLAVCCDALAYVDDILATVTGPGQFLLTYMVLVVATNFASLSVEDHKCVWVVCSRGRVEARHFLQAFPTSISPDGPEGFRLALGPVELYLELLQKAGVLPPGTKSPDHALSSMPV